MNEGIISFVSKLCIIENPYAYLLSSFTNFVTFSFFPEKKKQHEDLELPLLDLAATARATNNFSVYNKLGEGGFGPVYKVNPIHMLRFILLHFSQAKGSSFTEILHHTHPINALTYFRVH